METDISSVLTKFIDWKDFEKFVASMYADSAEVIVQHNVTLIGKYGDKRQVDVLVTQKTKLHTYKTIIECKFLSADKVDRGIVDVLAAAVEDLDANKGAIITTVGYEAGAIEYAKSKNIDIFIIRNVLEDEWGNTGKVLRLWLQMFSSRIANLNFHNPRFLSINGSRPTSNRISITLNVAKDQKFPDDLILHDLVTNTKGKNLLQMLFDIQLEIASDLKEKTQGYIRSKENEVIFLKTNANIDFSNYPYRFLPHSNSFIELERLTVTYMFSINQTKMEFDRSASFDLVLMVENYITSQKNFVSKERLSDKITLSAPVVQSTYEPNDDLRQGAIIKVTTDYYVGFEIDPNAEVLNLNDVTVNLELPATNANTG